MGDYPNQIPVYKPLKYNTGQLRAGLHGVRRPSGSVNIFHKETTINNFGGGFMMDYGYYDTGLTKGQKWGLGIAGVLGGIGAILSAIFGAKTETKGNAKEPENTESQELKDQLEQLKKNNEALEEQIRDLTDDLKAKKTEDPQQVQTPQTSRKSVADAEEVKQEPQYAEFNVTAKKIGDNLYRGYTGYNIVAAKYKSEDGTPLTHSEVMSICDNIFKGKALPTGKINLPLEIEVNGKKYTYDKNVPDENVKPSEYSLKNYETYKSSAVAVGSKYAPTVDGKRVGSTLYETRDEAVKAAEDEIAKREKEENK